VKEFLQGRRSGFALRPPLGAVAAGLAIAVTLLDLMSWFAWGVRETNALVVGAQWAAVATAMVALLALATALAEVRDVPEEETTLARTDVAVAATVVVLYLASAAARAADPGAAAASPMALLLAVAGLLLLLAGSALSSFLYASREWEELAEIVHERHRRRRAAGR
jgi:hypothetical protein